MSASGRSAEQLRHRIEHGYFPSYEEETHETGCVVQAQPGRYTAIVPALPGCISEGDTRDEALSNILEALASYLEPPLFRIREAVSAASTSRVLSLTTTRAPSWARRKAMARPIPLEDPVHQAGSSSSSIGGFLALSWGFLAGRSCRTGTLVFSARAVSRWRIGAWYGACGCNGRRGRPQALLDSFCPPPAASSPRPSG